MTPVRGADAGNSEGPSAHGGRDAAGGGRGLASWEFWLLTLVGLVVLALVLANTLLSMGNRTLRDQVAERQRFINETIQLSRLNTQLIQALADTSARTGDEALRDLLADQGIRFTVSETPGVSGSGASPGSGGGGIRRP
jgi:hypothetical protein